ncbi:MAG TPA: DUF502 domain-containing protein [Candidatus Latescibacteria bacterium]|nr:DUF502 domain-containing protein [Candidatus Latescibacterota bacterium]HQI76377.1 DUF502 domain-containing protein [Candidatus Latescibacterota bacterium]HQK22214.1 DUF502 domain-containing protein [Candidatus Latescibacterota bacterium]
MMPNDGPSTGWRHWAKANFLTGLVALAPVVITGYVLWYVFTTVDAWLSAALVGIPWLTWQGKPLPGVGFVTVLLIILLTGVVARNVAGFQFLRFWDRQLNRIPMVRGIYRAVKQISQAFFGGTRSVFQAVVLVPFPTRGIYAVGFLTSDAPREVCNKTGQDLVSVFLPTSPNPTSGYLIMVPRAEVTRVEMTVEEAMKLVISGGTVLPPEAESGADGVTERAQSNAG